MDVTFRDASLDEDAHLSRILYNAFLPIWNHNWFQNLAAPLDSIPTSATSSTSLSTLQSRRLAFYRALISLTRNVGGSVTVAESSSPSSPPTIAAILLFLPPHVRPSALTPIVVWKSGWLSAMWGYGIRCAYRVLGVFEANVDRMLEAAVPKHGWKPTECGFVQIIARNPEWDGERGAAGKLLAWHIERFWRGDEGLQEAAGKGEGKVRVPVILDSTTESAIRVYGRIGFQLVGETKLQTGTDGRGMRTEGAEAREESERICKQRVMLLMPEWKKV